MKRFLFLVPVLACACGTPHAPNTKVHIDSSPAGARIFASYGASQGMAKTKQYVGTTPCDWAVKERADGSFEITEGVPIMNLGVPRVVIVSAEPPEDATNCVPKEQVFKSGALWRSADRVPPAIFFDLRPGK
jgi:hypothetical protein